MLRQEIPRSGSSKVLISELLREGLTALERIEAESPTELINTNSNGWSSLPSAWMSQVLEGTCQDRPQPSGVGDGGCFGRRAAEWKEKIEYPEELFALMAALAPQADSVYLPFDDSALAIFEVTKETQEVTLRPHSERIHRLLRRALFVADRQATLQEFSPYTTESIPDASLTLIIPPFGERPVAALVMDNASNFRGPTSTYL